MEAVLVFGRGRGKLSKSSNGEYVGGGRGGGSLPSANPDNVAAGGATDARCGEGGSWRGEGRGGMG
jgi:hypothetical protein